MMERCYKNMSLLWLNIIVECIVLCDIRHYKYMTSVLIDVMDADPHQSHKRVEILLN